MIRIAFSLSRSWFAVLCLLAFSGAWAQEAAITKRATELRDKPGAAGNATPLAANTQVTRLQERQGPYVQVRTAQGTTGWVHIFDLGPASGSANTAPEANSGGGALRGVTNLFSRSGSSTTGTAASGIRGLGAEDLARATPNPAAVGQMEGLRASEQEAQAFARSASLRAVQVEALPAPARPSGGNNQQQP
jgi:hypothetical protein